MIVCILSYIYNSIIDFMNYFIFLYICFLMVGI